MLYQLKRPVPCKPLVFAENTRTVVLAVQAHFLGAVDPGLPQGAEVPVQELGTESGVGPVVTGRRDVPSITSRADLYKYVVKELTEIIPNLRSDVSDASYGKFTQGAARMVLAKMYLNAEEWIGEPNWKGVVEQCDEIMKLEYIIEPNWKTNFEVHNEVSREIIFPICYKASGYH